MTGSATLLGGRYEIGEVIGRGGMAEVHRGRDTRLGRTVAIKLLRADLARDPAFQSRFRREAQSAASLNSPAIVKVYDTGEGDVGGFATPYIVMEYVEGRTLREVLAAEGRLLPQRALEITAAVCTALEHAHSAGIVHRDIKPANVMLTPSGQVKVMDFGIARALTSSAATMTQTAAVVGTAHYLSPEQARGEHVDARSDVYSTGCLLYELLTGAPPFTGDTAVAVAYQHVREEPLAPSAIEADIPADADAIVLVAMAKNPIDRYSSAAAMRTDIQRALAGEPVSAAPVRRDDGDLTSTLPPTTVLVREPPKARRTASYVTLGVATLAVFVIALVIARNLLSGSSGDLNAPSVVGQSLASAETTLENAGLTVGSISHRYTSSDNRGTVIAQTPPAQVLLRHGQSVSLVVSNGIKFVQVPSGLVGLTQNQARKALQAAGLQVGRVISHPSDAPAGQVLSTSPKAGSSVPDNSKVLLVVSNAEVKVPDVVGKPLATAVAILQQAGFDVNTAASAVFEPGKLGLVLSQAPSGHTFATDGSTVTVFYDKKPTPKKPKKSASPNPSASASGSPSSSPSAKSH